MRGYRFDLYSQYWGAIFDSAWTTSTKPPKRGGKAQDRSLVSATDADSATARCAPCCVLLAASCPQSARPERAAERSATLRRLRVPGAQIVGEPREVAEGARIVPSEEEP